MGPNTTFRRSYLDAVLVEQLQSAWKIVLPGLLKVQKHSVSHWIPEDVYAALRTGHSTLHLAYVGEEYAGFVVLTPTTTWDGKVLHIWCAYGVNGCDVVNVFIGEIEKMARGYGAKRVTFQSPRKWDRVIMKHGYTPVQTEYAKELI